MRIAQLGALLAVAAVASTCSKTESKQGPAPRAEKDNTMTTPQPDPSQDKPADPCQGAVAKGLLRWFEDDYPAARACAIATKRPLFIDLWAPWCHTCIAMQSGVFMDPGLAPLADRFVWLAIDTDKDRNAALQIKFPPQVWPTFYVISPHDESVQARYPGAASFTQFRELLIAGEQGFLDSTGSALPPDSPLGLAREGDRAMAAGDLAAAARAYRAALDRAPADWPRRPDVLVSLINALARARDWQACAELGAAHMNSTGQSASVTDFILQVNKCAGELDDKARAAALRKAAIERLTRLIDDASAPLSKDDRSDAMLNLRELLLAMGENDKARAMAERQRAFLDQAAAEAPDAFVAMTYNWPRSEVYAFLGKPAELVPDLQKSMAALPNEYDPPYRLAWIYLQMGEHDKALAAAEKALGLIYGPRKARAQVLVAEIHKARGDRDAERAARQKVVEIHESLPAGQKNESALAEARAALAAMDKVPAK